MNFSHPDQVLARKLHAMASGLTQDAGICVALGDEGWSWNVETNTINVPVADLNDFGLEHVLGCIAHEAGHRLISRYISFNRDGLHWILASEVANALEDPRSEAFMMKRYPGSVSWISNIYSEVPDIVDGEPRVSAFLTGCVTEPYHNWLLTLSDNVQSAVIVSLEQTRDARRRLVNQHPDPGWRNPGHPLEVPELICPPRDGMTEQERIVLDSAWRAWRIACDEIMPVARKLHQQDVCQLAAVIVSVPEFLDIARKSLLLGQGLLRALVRIGLSVEQPRIEPPQWALKQADELLYAWYHGTQGSSIGEDLDLEKLEQQVRKKLSEAGAGVSPENSTPIELCYDEIFRRYAHDIARLVQDVEEVIQPRRNPQYKTGFLSGNKPDLRKIMQRQADPSMDNRIWQRREVPDRTDLAVFLLVDLSGSMASAGKDIAAVTGMIILAEFLNQLEHVQWAAAGFQNQCIPLIDFNEGLTPTAKQRIVNSAKEIHGCNPGGHNYPFNNDDGPAVLESASRLFTSGCAQQLLVVVSDGLPEGERSNANDLKSAIQQVNDSGIKIIGVGIGDGTEHVADFYPQHIASVSVTEFPQRIAQLLKSVLIDEQ